MRANSAAPALATSRGPPSAPVCSCRWTSGQTRLRNSRQVASGTFSSRFTQSMNMRATLTSFVQASSPSGSTSRRIFRQCSAKVIVRGLPLGLSTEPGSSLPFSCRLTAPFSANRCSGSRGSSLMRHRLSGACEWQRDRRFAVLSSQRHLSPERRAPLPLCRLSHRRRQGRRSSPGRHGSRCPTGSPWHTSESCSDLGPIHVCRFCTCLVGDHRSRHGLGG